MKRFKYILLLIAIFGVFASCDDLLTVESPDELTSDTFWRNKEDAEKGLAATYSMLEAAYDVWEFAEVKWPVEAYREDICVLGDDALNYPNWVELSNFTYTNGNSQFSLYWSCNYRGLNYANQVISKVTEMSASQIDDASKKIILGEAYFLRAYYHMKLILNWNQIVVRDKYVTSTADLNKGLSPRAETWDFIVSDFEKAASMLPTTRGAAEIGRATSNAANAYLGFSLLTMSWEQPDKKTEILGQAEKALNEVKGFDLVKDYISMFDGSNKNSVESVFELQFSETTANGAWYRTALHKWMAVGELGGWDEIRPSTRLMEEFIKEGKIATTGGYDSRLYATVFFKDEFFNDGTGKVYGYEYDDLFEQDKPSFRKYLPRNLADLVKSRTSLNVPLMRYSNVLLMKAEVLNELNRTNEAIPLINKVRERADMPGMTGTSKADVMAQIEHERMIEFPLENFRFYDLRRWGKTQEALHAVGRNSFDKSKHDFYPVPLLEIQSNPAVRP